MASDQHICLSCNQTIQGLENYVHHRTKECISHDKSSVNCLIASERGLCGGETLHEDTAKGGSEMIKYESKVDENQIKDSLFDLGVQRELDKTDFKRFFNLIKQNEMNSHQTSLLDLQCDLPNDIEEYSARGISIRNILKQYKAFTFCAMFVEGRTNRTDNSSLTRQERLKTKLDTNSTIPTTAKNGGPVSSCSQIDLGKKMTTDQSNRCPSVFHRKIITRLSVGIRKPSSRYLSNDQKTSPKETTSPSSSDRKEMVADDERTNGRSRVENGAVRNSKKFVSRKVDETFKNLNTNKVESNLSRDKTCCDGISNSRPEPEDRVQNISDAFHFDQIENVKESSCPLHVENHISNPNLEIENKSSHEIRPPLPLDQSSDEEFFVECLVCKCRLYSTSELLNHLKSPCLTEFQANSSNNSKLMAAGDSNQIVEPSIPAIKRKKGRPPKVSKKPNDEEIGIKTATPTSHSTLVGTDVLLSLKVNGTREVNTETLVESRLKNGKLLRSERIVCDNQKSKTDGYVAKKIITFKRQKNQSRDEPSNLDDREKQFWCNVCGLGLSTLEKLKSHKIARTHLRKLEEMKSGDGKNYKCQRCGRLFYALNILQFHELNHALTDSSRTKRKKPAVVTASKRDAPDVECDPRHRQTTPKCDDDELATVTCPECDEKMPKTKISSHLRQQHVECRSFKCTFCQKQFTDVAVMRRHLRAHLGIMYYKCPVCQKEFNRKSTMQSHALREHGVEEVGKHGVLPPSHQCCHCGRQFMQLSQLTAHMKLHDKQLKCPHLGCTSLFRYKSELLVHFQTHSAERKFLCDECGYSGKSRHQLKRHQRLHAGDKRYQCNFCSYKTTLAANLRRHERVHTGSKPYKCLYCGYSCNTQENLRKHILKTRRHAGKFVYPCQMCAFATNSAQDFQHHLETEHQKDRQTLPSIRVGMYQPDDKKNNVVDLKSSDEMRLKISNGNSKRKKPADNQNALEGGSTSLGGPLEGNNSSNFEACPLTVDQSIRLGMAHSTSFNPLLLSEVENNQTIGIQNQFPQNVISQLIIPASQQSSFINALLQIQAANFPAQNNFQLPLLPLNSQMGSLQQTHMVLPQVTSQTNVCKYALQINNNGHNPQINTVSNQFQRLATIAPNNLILLLQSPDGKHLIDNVGLQNGINLLAQRLNGSEGASS